MDVDMDEKFHIYGKPGNFAPRMRPNTPLERPKN